MRSAQECAEAARRLIRAAHREPDPAVRKRLLSLANANRGLVRLARLLARKSQQSEYRKESMKVDYEHDLNQGPLILEMDRETAPAVEDDLFMSVLRGKDEYEWEDGITPDQKIAVLKAIVDEKQQQFADLKKRHSNLRQGIILFAALCVFPLIAMTVSVFPRAVPTYCDKLIIAANELENSGKDEDDELKVLETKAHQALKPLVQDCLEMAD